MCQVKTPSLTEIGTLGCLESATISCSGGKNGQIRSDYCQHPHIASAGMDPQTGSKFRACPMPYGGL